LCVFIAMLRAAAQGLVRLDMEDLCNLVSSSSPILLLPLLLLPLPAASAGTAGPCGCHTSIHCLRQARSQGSSEQNWRYT
jgi:hypothetical protein